MVPEVVQLLGPDVRNEGNSCVPVSVEPSTVEGLTPHDVEDHQNAVCNLNVHFK